jgi:mycofactocin precursor
MPDPTAVTQVPDEADAVDQEQPADDSLVLDDLLVEDVSIDGMCGVY